MTSSNVDRRYGRRGGAKHASLVRPGHGSRNGGGGGGGGGGLVEREEEREERLGRLFRQRRSRCGRRTKGRCGVSVNIRYIFFRSLVTAAEAGLGGASEAEDLKAAVRDLKRWVIKVQRESEVGCPPPALQMGDHP